MQISILLLKQIVQLFLMIFMGYIMVPPLTQNQYS